MIPKIASIKFTVTVNDMTGVITLYRDELWHHSQGQVYHLLSLLFV